MSETVTRSGRKVKSVVRYEPPEENLIDDFSDGSFGDSDFDGTLDGMSVGSHVENTDSSDESYVPGGGATDIDCESTEENDEGELETDDDSVITEHVPEEEIIDIPSSSESSEASVDSSSSNDGSSSSDSSDSDSSSESSGESSGEESSSDDDESDSGDSLPTVKEAWKKRRRQQ